MPNVHNQDSRQRALRPHLPRSTDGIGGGRKELAHIRCDHTTGVRLGENPHRGRKETEAKSVAHPCCRALRLDTQVYTDFSGGHHQAG